MSVLNAGKRPGKALGVVIHNDAGSSNATAKSYASLLNAGYDRLARGYAHFYIDERDRVEVAPLDYMAWHTANATGNTWFVGVEVCQSMGDEAQFLRNEQATFKWCAEWFRSVGLTPNRETVRLHREFSSTACPHRSWDLHGQSVNAVKDYFISQILKYMNGSASQQQVQVSQPQKQPEITSGLIRQNGTCDVLVDVLNVRSAPSKNAQVVATYKKGQVFNYDSYIDAEGIRWVSYVSFSGARRYVARRTLDNTQIFTTAR